MKIALICPTIGQTQRGYERYFSDLFHFIRHQTDIILFKGGGEHSEQERVVTHLRRTGILARLSHGRLAYPRHVLEFASFAAAVWPALLRGAFDVVHFIDPPLGPHFARLRRWTNAPARLLFSNAGPRFQDASRFADHIHGLTPAAYRQAAAQGVQRTRLSWIPMGVDPIALRPQAPPECLRQRYGISPQQFVILCLASVNRYHKRVDYLLREAAGLPGQYLVWLDGSLHPDGDPSLLQLGRQTLGERFRYSHVPSAEVPNLLACANVVVSTAVQESFGMAIAEAMAAAVPVVVHNSAHFRWLTAGEATFVDMTCPGALHRCLFQILTRQLTLSGERAQHTVLQRFGWPSVAARHLEMYRRVCRP